MANPKEPIQVTPAFQFALRFTAISTVILWVLSTGLAFYTGDHPTEMQKGLFETFTTLSKMGFGAVIGLVGGKAIA